MNPRRIYLASSWRNEHQPRVVRALRDAGHDVYDFRNPRPGDNGFAWSEIDPGWQAWGPVRFREALKHPIAEAGFDSDWSAMQWAHTGVLLLPCGRSAHLEAGYFVGARKPLHILILGLPEPELMYAMADGIHAEIDDLIAALEQPEAGKPDPVYKAASDWWYEQCRAKQATGELPPGAIRPPDRRDHLHIRRLYYRHLADSEPSHPYLKIASRRGEWVEVAQGVAAPPPDAQPQPQGGE